ncbi:hypothetical protein [Kibdelosporangium philippinense]|uniref:hypothetical protein n=1 Tax=Kibdelosporangium philippinense TaxID=211113 RepID=UPI003608D7F9
MREAERARLGEIAAGVERLHVAAHGKKPMLKEVYAELVTQHGAKESLHTLRPIVRDALGREPRRAGGLSAEQQANWPTIGELVRQVDGRFFDDNGELPTLKYIVKKLRDEHGITGQTTLLRRVVRNALGRETLGRCTPGVLSGTREDDWDEIRSLAEEIRDEYYEATEVYPSINYVLGTMRDEYDVTGSYESLGDIVRDVLGLERRERASGALTATREDHLDQIRQAAEDVRNRYHKRHDIIPR